MKSRCNVGGKSTCEFGIKVGRSRGRVLESVRTRDVQSDEATAMAEAKRRQGRTMVGTSDGGDERWRGRAMARNTGQTKRE